MSIINQVLAQLERRGVKVNQDMVRAVPPPRSAHLLPWLLAVLALAGAAWWWLDRDSAAGGRMPQPAMTMRVPVLPVVPSQISGVAAQGAGASRSGVPEAISSVQVAPPVVLAALPPAHQLVPKPAQPSVQPKPVLQSVSPPKGTANLPVVTLEKAKSAAAALPATQKAAASSPPKSAPPAPHAKPAVKSPAAVPSMNKAAAPKPHRDKPVATDIADGSMPMKQISRTQLAETEFRKGIELTQGGRRNEAIASYQAALQLDGGHDAARQALVALLLEDKRRDEAERLLQSRLDEKPQHSGFAMLLARLQVERGAPGEAQVTLERSLAYAETKADYLAFLAALQQRNNFHAEAVAHYQAALQLQPGNGAWLMGYGISLQALRRNEEAKAAYQQALDSKSLSADLQAFVQRKLKGL